MTIYSDLNNKFQFLDYSASHGQLLIRSMRNKNRAYNIDILFKAAKCILMPTTMQGIEISLSENESCNKFLMDKYDFDINYRQKIFSIKNAAGKEYFVNAMCFGVFHSKLDILETSLGRYDMGENMEEEVLWYPETKKIEKPIFSKKRDAITKPILVNSVALEERVKEANESVKYLMDGKAYNVAGLRLEMIDKDTLGIIGPSEFKNIEDITKRSSLNELMFIKMLFTKIIQTSNELADFVQNLKIKYELVYGDFGKDLIVICMEKDGIVNWNSVIK